MGTLKLAARDVGWLASVFPSLWYEQMAQKIVGELDFCACYEEATRRLRIEYLEVDQRIRQSSRFLCDAFEIEIRTDSKSVEANGWPKVYEVGGRYESIAKRCGVAITELHINLDGSCCLGIREAPDRYLTIQRFIYDLVVPFFYRLSYAERWGIQAARSDLWGEYSHAEEGGVEYLSEMWELAQSDPRRNDPCPCGSGIKYKKCCLDEVQAFEAGINALSKD